MENKLKKESDLLMDVAEEVLIEVVMHYEKIDRKTLIIDACMMARNRQTTIKIRTMSDYLDIFTSPLCGIFINNDGIIELKLKPKSKGIFKK